MNFYSHQDSYTLIDRTELKRLIHRISTTNFTSIYTPYWYELVSRKAYSIIIGITDWNEELLVCRYNEFSYKEMQTNKDELLRYGNRADKANKFFREYTIKLGFYRNK